MADSCPPISARTQVLAIIGDPIEHSLTPRIQNMALREIGADIVNVALRVPSAQLERAISGARALGLLGLMVTIPHKEAALRFCDELDESARQIGAANLLHCRADGKIIGYSTDGWAALKSLEEEGIAVRGARVAILGGGGAARSLAITLAHAQATSIVLLNRTLERAQRIAAEIAAQDTTAQGATTQDTTTQDTTTQDTTTQGAAAQGMKVQALPLDEATLREILPHTDLLINATSVGMHPREDETPLPSHVLHSHLAVYDIVYNPLETRLLREAKAANARVVDGLGMLIYTNVRAVQICAGLDIAASIMRAEALAALKR